ncbi:MAG: hypothetical protein U0264_05735 [Candidatus Kapaibacterium sp.]
MQLQKIRKYLKISLLAVPCIVVMWKLSPFEIADAQLSDVVCYLLWSVVAICILAYGNIVIYEGNKRDTAFKNMMLIFYNISWCLILYCLSVVVIFGSMCASIENDVYISTSFFPTKIIRSHIDCGAYDSDFPKYSFHKVVEITPFVRYISVIDTANIDKSEWIFVGKSGQ